MTEILIVDSDRPVRNTLCHLLENRGYACTLAANGLEARRYLCQQPFDLIISDIVFPHESGIEFVRFALSSAKKTAVIVMTGIDDPQVAEKMLREGAADFILKPVQEAAILVAVTNSIRRLERETANVSALKDMEHRLVERITQMQQTIHHLEQTQKALQESEGRYRELVEGANSVILRLDPTGRITFINAFGTAFFGYEPSEIVGRNVIGTIIPESEGARDAALKTTIEDILKHPHRYRVNENENIRKNGERVWVAWTNRGLYDKDGHLLEILSIGNDITRRKQAEEKSRLLASVL
jgi:PAS domain S-box-containing protein